MTPAPVTTAAARRAVGRILATAVLAGIGTVLALEVAALALAAAPQLAGLRAAWSHDAVAVGCVALALAAFRYDRASAPWQLVGVVVSAASAIGCVALLRGLAAGIDLPLVPVALVGAVSAGALLSPRRRAELVRVARSAAADAAGDAVVILDAHGRLLDANEVARSVLEIPSVAPSEGGSASPLGAFPQPTLEKILSDPECRYLAFETHSARSFEAWIAHEDRGSSLHGARALVIRDVTDRRIDERRLLHLAHHDSLTGLPNRHLFLEELAQAVSAASASKQMVALLYIDLDNFKDVNDSLGHAAGDELLRALARRFRQHVRTEDMVALDVRAHGSARVSRLAGDEFAVVVPVVPDPESAGRIAERILKLIAEPVPFGERTLTSHGSIGIALFPRDGEDLETLIKNADAALYAAKRLGRNRCVFYESSFTEQADRSRSIEAALRQAIPRGELRLHYQPKVDLASGTMVGVEALMRWRCAELGTVGPKEFIPVAESRGLIGEIGTWSIAEACRQICAWRDAGFVPVPVSVNVSSAQFIETDLERVVTTALRDSGVEPRLLELELTESLLLEESDATGSCLRNLRAIGVRIALDDFGTGYSALTYLNRIPLDVLKMDRGFVRDIEYQDSAAGIASAVVAMAHALNLTVVAEGVDSDEQLALLREMRCDQIQGFVYAPALAPDTIVRHFARVGGTAPLLEQAAKPSPGSRAIERSRPVEAPDGHRKLARDHPRRVLLLDDSRGSLASVALRLTRLGVDAHYAAFAEEAYLLISQERSRIRLVAAPPTVDLTAASSVLRHLATELEGVKPSFLVLGEEPDAGIRENIRAAGAQWVLWAPFDDAELRLLVNSSMALPEELVQRKDPRVPTNLMAWVRAGSRRDVGVISDLSPRGAFIELSDPLPAGARLRVEFVLPTGRVRSFASVVHQRPDDPRRPAWTPRGMGVLFDPLEPHSGGVIREFVLERSARYQP